MVLKLDVCVFVLFLYSFTLVCKTLNDSEIVANGDTSGEDNTSVGLLGGQGICLICEFFDDSYFYYVNPAPNQDNNTDVLPIFNDDIGIDVFTNTGPCLTCENDTTTSVPEKTSDMTTYSTASFESRPTDLRSNVVPVSSNNITASHTDETGVQDPHQEIGTDTKQNESVGTQHFVDTLSSRMNILTTIMEDYYRHIRPVLDQRRTILVASRFSLLGVLGFDTQRQVIDIFAFFVFQWIDDVIKNKPTNIKTTTGIDTMRVPGSSLWVPGIKISKELNHRSMVGSVTTDRVIIQDNGFVEWIPEGVFSIPCEVDIEYYPFDEQTCVLTYFPSTETTSRVDIKHVTSDVNLRFYVENAEWALVKASHTRRLQNDVAHIDIELKLKRRAGFGFMTMVMPVILISALSCSTFLIPITSGEKQGVAITYLLAYGLFLTVVIDSLPPNSYSVPYYVLYVDCEICLATLLVLYCIIQSKVDHDIGNMECRAWSHVQSICKRYCCDAWGCVDQVGVTWAAMLKKLDNVMFFIFAFLHSTVNCLFLFILIRGK